MNLTVENFYSKNAEQGYASLYDLDHGERLDCLIDYFNLKNRLAGKRVLDVGGGFGFLGKRLQNIDYWVVDGANIRPEQKLCAGTWLRHDLDHDFFSQNRERYFDVAFCLETLEHIGNPHHALVEIKKMVVLGGIIYLSIPTETVTHNVPYPGLLWPRPNWERFLAQMALLPANFWQYNPIKRGWPAYCYECTNQEWAKKIMLFQKREEKFRDCTPLEATNL